MELWPLAALLRGHHVECPKILWERKTHPFRQGPCDKEPHAEGFGLWCLGGETAEPTVVRVPGGMLA